MHGPTLMSLWATQSGVDELLKGRKREDTNFERCGRRGGSRRDVEVVLGGMWRYLWEGGKKGGSGRETWI